MYNYYFSIGLKQPQGTNLRGLLLTMPTMYSIREGIYFSLSRVDVNRAILIIVCREFARTIPRPFSVRYNPYTQTVEVIKDKPSMEKVLNDVRYELDILQDAIGKKN